MYLINVVGYKYYLRDLGTENFIISIAKLDNAVAIYYEDYNILTYLVISYNDRREAIIPLEEVL